MGVASMMKSVDTAEERCIFPHVFIDQTGESTEDIGTGDAARSTTEQRMCLLSTTLRSKPSWWTKYKDPAIRTTWRSEALDQEILGHKLNEAEIDYVLDELEGYDLLRDESTGAEVSCFERIWQSDTLIPTDLRDQLISEIKKLEDVPDEKKDWHPRSNDLVLDLVHPSLYCLVYGRTGGYGPDSDPNNRSAADYRVIVRERFQGPDEYCISEKFAWIPTDFHIEEHGMGAKAKSYINNLHPSFTGLYKGIEMVIARFSHLFDRVLTDLHPKNPLRRRTTGGYYYEDDESWPEPEEEEGEDEDAYDRRVEEWQENRPIVIPTIRSEGYTGGLQDRNTQYSIQDRDVQIIVKLANIHLTPEKPEYDGGSWHVEGMANECIVASGIYYYSSENITSNRLAFRESVSFNESYEQSDTDGVMRAWGLRRDGPSCQDLGAVETIEGRCIAFPNIYQHKVSSFKLVDPTKPGHRKIIALFLIDPSLEPIHSTSNIPPQQADWVREAMNEVPASSLLHKLPVELLDIVSANVSTTMTIEEAKRYREELMDERTVFVEEHDSNYFEVEFNLCEH